jgi:hypothetical protein
MKMDGLNRREWLSAAVVGVAAAPLVHGQGEADRKLLPRNDADKDPALKAFLANMNAIVQKKDAAKLLALMGPVFKVELFVGKGPGVFKSHWHPEDPKSEVWVVLERVLALGGTFYEKDMYAAPYVYTKFPMDVNLLEYVAVVKDAAPLRAEAKADAAVVETLSYDIVQVEPALTAPVRLDKQEWVQVATAGGKKGYVASADVYSPAGYRVLFEKQAGRWHWLSLVCPD